jgi:coenzyme F420-0:L-glutamate ligase / coenzyme F420-1:gamma-L-glutamate ligase
VARGLIQRTMSKRLKVARVARLATVDAKGRPHVVPICFAYDGKVFYTGIDRKPKRVPAERLTRVRNIGTTPQVALVVDEYFEDWTRLWYVLVRGRAVLVRNAEERRRAIRMLRKKYRQYAAGMLEDDALVIRIVPRTINSWGGGP